MKILLRLLPLCLTVAAAHAAIVLDEGPQEPETSKPRIDVPAPRGGAGATQEKAAAPSDAVRFLNKDTLHGLLLGYGKESGIRWQSPESKEPITFKSDAVAEIKLDSHKAPASADKAAHAVGLTNDDELPGTIISLNDKALLLETWYAGKLTIPRAMLKRITPLSATASTLFEGPTSLEGWVAGRSGNRKSWSYRDGALLSTNYGTIGRDVKLPPIASIEFDMVYRGNSQVNACFYADRLDNISNCYMLQMNNNYFSLQRYSRDGGNNNVGEPAQLGNAMRRDKTHIDIRVNKETKSIWLLVDGRMVKQWTDPGEFAGAGTSLIFSGQSGTFVKISNIKVRKWDGRIEPPRGSAAEKIKEDSIKLANQDKVSGTLKKIDNGKAHFASSYADLTIPLERMEEIVLANEAADTPKTGATDVRAYFADRGTVTMQLESWDEKKATASSPNFGKATFSPDAFQRLQFNLSQQPSADDEAGEMLSAGEDN